MRKLLELFSEDFLENNFVEFIQKKHLDLF